MCVCARARAYAEWCDPTQFHLFSIQLLNSFGSLPRKTPNGFSRLNLIQICFIYGFDQQRLIWHVRLWDMVFS